MRAAGLESAMIDRLTLSEKSVVAIPTASIRLLRCRTRWARSPICASARPVSRSGRMRVPLGVIGIIHEARPNVIADAAALCLKSGNAAILRGGSEVIHCNRAIAALVHEALAAVGLPPHAVQVDTTDRAAVGQLITMREYVDVIVPRGGKGLIARLLAESRVPMIQHLDGNCHVYLDDEADVLRCLSG